VRAFEHLAAAFAFQAPLLASWNAFAAYWLLQNLARAAISLLALKNNKSSHSVEGYPVLLKYS
jgi:hypothetical protein